MKTNLKSNNKLTWFGISVLFLCTGLISAALIAILTLRFYQPKLSEIHQHPSQQFEFPGEYELDLNRKGAYAIYYIRNKDSSNLKQWPLSIHCQLISKKTNGSIPLVPDYVPSNRNCSQISECTGVLVYSTTVNQPGLHTFSCTYPEDQKEPKIILAIGPNYVFEFLRLIWNIRWSILSIPCVLCFFSTTAIISVVIALIKWKDYQHNSKGKV
jgi:hypothetical protein